MKKYAKIASLSAAVMAVSFGLSAKADILTLDVDINTAGAQDGTTGGLDFTNVNWLASDGVTNRAFQNGDSIVLGSVVPAGVNGNGDNAIAYNSLTLGADVTVQNITFAQASNGAIYHIEGFGNSINLSGDIIKSASAGTAIFSIFSGNLNLSAGNHNIVVRDSPGGASAELIIGVPINGAGGVTIDNGVYQSYGTTTFNDENSYTGVTNINRGRLSINFASGLGSTAAGTVISGAGTLSIGGSSLVPAGNLTINEPITITRSKYTGGDAAGDPGTDTTAFSNYADAIRTDGGNRTHTFAAPITLNTTEARIGAYSSTLQVGAAVVNPNNIPLTVTGDFAGFVRFTVPQPNLAVGGVAIMGGVELIVNDDAEIGGANSPLTFNGGTARLVGKTSFGTHVINATTFNGGLNVLDGTTFNVDIPLGQTENAVGTFSKRGTGTLNFNSPVNLRGGQTYWDAGTVNVNNTMQLANLHLRSPIVNIGTGGSVTLPGTGAGAYSALGQDSTGTNGGPDIAVVNLTGNGVLAQTGTGDPDFNVSDNANTRGTINISGTATLATSGRTYLGKNTGAIGAINQSGGTVNINRGGDFALVIGRDGGQGIYTMTGGSLNLAGEFFVGQGGANGMRTYDAATNTGTQNRFLQSGGTVTANNWFVVGREGGTGYVNLSNGAVFIKKGNGNVEIDAAGNTAAVNPSVMNVDNATFDVQTGELRVGTYGGSNGTLNIRNGGTVTVNNWIGVGRDNGTGAINLEGGTLTKAGANNISIGWQPSSNGRIVQTGGTFSVTGGQTWIGEGGTALYSISAGTANILRLDVGHAGGGNATLTVTGGSLTTTETVLANADSVTATVNLSGGSFTTGAIRPGGGTGAKTFNWTGGNLAAASYTLGALSAPAGSTFSPNGAGTGATAISGGYSQTATSILDIDIAGLTAFDAITAGGASTINGIVNVDVLGGYDTAGQTFDVFTTTTGGLTGTFTLTGNGAAQFTSSIVNGNTLRLTSVVAVPEPSSLAALGLGAAAALRRKRRV